MSVNQGDTADVYTYRQHSVCLMTSDWARFADAIYDTFPDGRYFHNPSVFHRMWAEPPSCMTGEHMLRLADAAGPIDPVDHNQTELHFDPDWRPDWFITGDPINPFLPEPGSYWDLRQPRLPAFRFEFSFMKPAQGGEPEHMSRDGQYWFFYEPGNREHLAIGHRVFRLFRDVASNRDQFELRNGIARRRRVSPLWLGHDAINWAKEDPSRLLAYYRTERGTLGVRPSA